MRPLTAEISEVIPNLRYALTIYGPSYEAHLKLEKPFPYRPYQAEMDGRELARRIATQEDTQITDFHWEGAR
jgi:hypothetical protein